MIRDDIIRMAQEASLCDANGEDDDSVNIAGQLERFAALVTAAEREECAQIAESTVCDTHLPTGVRIYGTRAAAAIRARTP